MLVSTIKEDNLTSEVIDQLLYQGLEDTGENVDCILVLGSMKADQYRVPVAAKAYKANRANKIILCGGKLRDFPNGKYSEAEYMRYTALEAGVLEEDIIIENASENTVENIRLGMEQIQKAFGINNIHSILLVTATYHMRRSLAIARCILPNHIKIIPCPADDNNTKRGNWMYTPAGTQRVKNEALKIVDYIKSKIIPDFEI